MAAANHVGLGVCAACPQAILDDFVRRTEEMGMSVQNRKVEPCQETRTVLGNDRDYEGGFVLLTVSRDRSAASRNA